MNNIIQKLKSYLKIHLSLSRLICYIELSEYRSPYSFYLISRLFSNTYPNVEIIHISRLFKSLWYYLKRFIHTIHYSNVELISIIQASF